MKRMEGRTALVSAGADGLGAAIAARLAQEGAKVTVLDRSAEAIDAAQVQPAMAGIRFERVDLTDASQTGALLGRLVSDSGGFDILVNNAGGSLHTPARFLDESDEDWDRVLALNLTAAVRLTRAVLPLLDMDRDNFIVNVSSMGGFLPVPGQSVYGASKAALRLFTEALYGEFKGTRLHISIVFPGAMATGIAKNSLEDQPGMQLDEKSGMKIKMTSAPVAAGRLIEGMEAGKLRIFVGKDARMMDRLYRLMPVKAINLMAGRIKGMLDKAGA